MVAYFCPVPVYARFIILMLHVNIIDLHVDINKSHANTILLHVKINYIARRGQKYATIVNSETLFKANLYRLINTLSIYFVILYGGIPTPPLPGKIN